MAARWSAEEHKTFKSLLANGVEINLLKQHLPNRTDNAIHRQAQNYGYGVKTVNGETVLYFGKRTRNRKKKKTDNASEEATKKIVGDTRSTTNISTPTTSESTNENLSDVIVADSTHNFNRGAFIHLSEDVCKLLNSEEYTVKNITVTLEDFVFTVCKNASVGVNHE